MHRRIDNAVCHGQFYQSNEMIYMKLSIKLYKI